MNEILIILAIVGAIILMIFVMHGNSKSSSQPQEEDKITGATELTSSPVKPFIWNLTAVTDKNASRLNQPVPAWNYWQCAVKFLQNNRTTEFTTKLLLDTGSSQFVIPSNKCDKCYATQIGGAWESDNGHMESGTLVTQSYVAGSLSGYYYDDPINTGSGLLSIGVLVSNPPTSNDTMSNIPGIMGICMYDDEKITHIHQILNRVDGDMGYTLNLNADNPQMMVGTVVKKGTKLPLIHQMNYMLTPCNGLKINGKNITPTPKYIIIDTGTPDAILSTQALNNWKTQTPINAGSRLEISFNDQASLAVTLDNPDYQLQTDDGITDLEKALNTGGNIFIIGLSMLQGHRLAYDFENLDIWYI